MPIRINELPERVLNSVTSIMVGAEFVNSVKSSKAIRSSTDMYRVVDRTMLNSLSLLDVGDETKNHTH